MRNHGYVGAAVGEVDGVDVGAIEGFAVVGAAEGRNVVGFGVGAKVGFNVVGAFDGNGWAGTPTPKAIPITAPVNTDTSVSTRIHLSQVGMAAR